MPSKSQKECSQGVMVGVQCDTHNDTRLRRTHPPSQDSLARLLNQQKNTTYTQEDKEVNSTAKNTALLWCRYRRSTPNIILSTSLGAYHDQPWCFSLVILLVVCVVVACGCSECNCVHSTYCTWFGAEFIFGQHWYLLGLARTCSLVFATLEKALSISQSTLQPERYSGLRPEKYGQRHCI